MEFPLEFLEILEVINVIAVNGFDGNYRDIVSKL